MSLTIALGSKALLSLGVSLGDIALLYAGRRRYGNFLRAAKNEEDLLESLGEDIEALLKRKSIVETTRMASCWTAFECVYEGERVSNDMQPKVASDQQLTALSWLMVAVVSALDLCLPLEGVHDLLIDVFHDLLHNDSGSRDPAIIDSLRVQLPTNIQSWRDVGRVRSLGKRLASHAKSKWKKLTKIEAIPQLNPAEYKEVTEFVLWLMEGKTHSYCCFSAIAFTIAFALQEVGIIIQTKGLRRYETEPVVTYAEHPSPFNHITSSTLPRGPSEFARGIANRAQVVTYPFEKPQDMIHTVPVPRSITNRMIHMWDLGDEAAKTVSIVANAQIPFESTSEVFYSIQEVYESQGVFNANVMRLADHAFPVQTEYVLLGLEKLIEGLDNDRILWLHRHTGSEFLSRTEDAMPSENREEMHLWAQYQAFVFGYYYRLLRPLLATDSIDKEAFFRGIWGYGSTSALAAFTDLAQTFRRHIKVSRSHLLHILSMMYAGRNQRYLHQHSRTGLLGILGSISIITMSLYKTTDVPDEIAKFAIVDLPIIDLAAEANGELYTGKGGSIVFDSAPVRARPIRPHGATGQWSVLAKMGVFSGESNAGVVMAARCNGRTVGYFSPLAADVFFFG